MRKHHIPISTSKKLKWKSWMNLKQRGVRVILRLKYKYKKDKLMLKQMKMSEKNIYEITGHL